MRRPHDEDPSPRQGLQLAPYHRPTDACRPPGIPSTSRNTSRRQCLRGGTVRRCSPRRVVLPARCGFSPPPSTADESGAECPSALVLPALCPARISVSSSLLTATMNQKSSLREVPQFVSWLLTGNSSDVQAPQTPCDDLAANSTDRRKLATVQGVAFFTLGSQVD